jgi:hypothetical protein
MSSRFHHRRPSTSTSARQYSSPVLSLSGQIAALTRWLALRVELMGFNDFAIPVGKFGFGIFLFYFSRKEGRLSGGGNP